MTKDVILKFIKSQNLAVVATVDPTSRPQASVVEFGELNDLTIIIDLLKSSRKYKNLQTNKSVAIVIGWDDDITVQIDGMAKQLSGLELEKAQKAYFTKNPKAKKWATHPEIVFFAIKPSWVRYSDVGKKPWLVEEFKI